MNTPTEQQLQCCKFLQSAENASFDRTNLIAWQVPWERGEWKIELKTLFIRVTPILLSSKMIYFTTAVIFVISQRQEHLLS